MTWDENKTRPDNTTKLNVLANIREKSVQGILTALETYCVQRRQNDNQEARPYCYVFECERVQYTQDGGSTGQNVLCERMVIQATAEPYAGS